MKHIYVILSLILSITCYDLYSQSRKVVFKEDFLDNRNNWETSTNDFYTARIQGGKYSFEHKRKEKFWFIVKPMSLDDSKNFSIESSFIKVSGDNDKCYGLIWGFKDANNYFEFLCNGNGFFSISKIENSVKKDIIQLKESQFVNKWDNAKNVFAIKKIGKGITFLINNNYVADFKFESFYGNKVGFLIYGNIFVKIDNLAIEQFEPENK